MNLIVRCTFSWRTCSYYLHTLSWTPIWSNHRPIHVLDLIIETWIMIHIWRKHLTHMTSNKASFWKERFDLLKEKKSQYINKYTSKMLKVTIKNKMKCKTYFRAEYGIFIKILSMNYIEKVPKCCRGKNSLSGVNRWKLDHLLLFWPNYVYQMVRRDSQMP